MNIPIAYVADSMDMIDTPRRCLTEITATRVLFYGYLVLRSNIYDTRRMCLCTANEKLLVTML
jgi:hypothetical protein